MISKLKTLIKLIIYSFIGLFISPSKEIKPKSILLIRLDAIGDYVLFRNYIEVLKKSEQYKDYKITLLGNSAYKGISQELDSEFVDEFIWLDRDSFSKDFIYRYKKLQEIVASRYEIVLSCVYSREFLVADAIVKRVSANEKIGSIGNTSNIKIWQKNISDKYYTRLIDADDKLMFEFYRNKEFFENLLNKKLEMHKPTIELKPKKLDFKLPKTYAILFIGASDISRKWSIKKFAKIGQHLTTKYNYKIVLCGAEAEMRDAREFKKYFKNSYLDLVGKTSLVELLYVIYHGDLMLANETSAPHFGVALDMKNLFVIYSGNHYGRFTPYPKQLSQNYHVICHPFIEKDLIEYKKLSNNYGYENDLDINDISVENVKNKIDRVLKGRKEIDD